MDVIPPSILLRCPEPHVALEFSQLALFAQLTCVLTTPTVGKALTPRLLRDLIPLSSCHVCNCIGCDVRAYKHLREAGSISAASEVQSLLPVLWQEGHANMWGTVEPVLSYLHARVQWEPADGRLLCMHMCVCAGACGGQKRVLNPIEMEVHVAVPTHRKCWGPNPAP